MWDAVSGGNQLQNIVIEGANHIWSVNSSTSDPNYYYDPAGNLVWAEGHSYAYDAENRLVNVDGGATGQYAYDPSNRRYKRVTGGATTHYIWQGSQVIAEHNGATGAVLVDYVYSGGRMIAKVASGTTQYFLSDRLSTRLVLDASGNVIGRQAHLPFGEDFAESGTQEKHHFTSYERDSETVSDYAVNRQYSQTTGRFNRTDTIPANVMDPQSFNRYVYARNNPINMIDPLGLQICDITRSKYYYEDDEGLLVMGVIETLHCDVLGDSGGSDAGSPPVENGPGGGDDPTTAEWHARRIKEALDSALTKLIDSIPCQALPGTAKWAAMPTLTRLQNEGRITEGDAHGDIAEYFCGLKCILGRNPGTITLDTVHFFGTAIENEAALHNVTIAEAQVETILHELARATGAMSGNEDDFDERIYNTCIKPSSQ
ncbi:MAG: RHS repeat-associated core domain-containing protein [Acidobacteriota bacterium]